MRGTAPRVDVWLLLEYTEMWAHDPTTTNSLPSSVRRWMERTVALLIKKGQHPRVQMIRRNRTARAGYSFYVSQSGELRHHWMQSYEELLDLDILMDSGLKIESNVYFVCTHGTRDRCCARFGHRTWSVLNDLSNGRAWQCSHLGGHRFAPNVLVLPGGRLYGRVNAEEAKSFFHIVEDDEIATEYLRGRSEFSPEDQVREAGILPVRDSPIQIRESCTENELKTVYPFIET